MTRLAYNLHRVFAGLLLLLVLFAGANYYLDLGLLGHRASKGILILAIGVIVVYGAFFSPTRQNMREHKEARKAAKN
ncbi:MAG: hypothetical protein ACREUC_15655 [Steroidobacteraceae bacterium]